MLNETETNQNVDKVKKKQQPGVDTQSIQSISHMELIIFFS